MASARDRLNFYTRHFQTLELNGSHHHWPRDASFRRWREGTPENFLMTVKTPRG